MNVKLVKGYWFGSLVLMFWFPVCHYRISEQWYSASEELDSESDSDQEETGSRSMSRGRGSVRSSDRPVQVGRHPLRGGR